MTAGASKCGVCRDNPSSGLLFCWPCTQAFERFNTKDPDTLQLLEWLARRVWRFANANAKGLISPRERELLRALAQAQDLFGQVESAYENDRSPTRADDVRPLTKKGFAVCLTALAPYPPGAGD